MSLAGPRSDPLTSDTASAGDHTSKPLPKVEEHLSSRDVCKITRTQSNVTFCAPAGNQDGMKSSEAWLRDYETAKQLADDTLAMIQVVLNGPPPFLPTLCPLVLWALVTVGGMYTLMLHATL